MRSPLRVGTRGSPLALAQTEEVLSRLRGIHPDLPFERIVIRTPGDEDERTDFGRAMDRKGGFTKPIEEELLAGRIDVAVHSLKDLPTELPPRLVLAAIPPRRDPRDVLVARNGVTMESLGPGVRVGTSSLRRRAQLLSRWPGMEVVDLHGNVGTRLRRLEEGGLDALVLAAAGLHRLGLQGRITQAFPPDVLTPAPGQGALGVEARQEDDEVLSILRGLEDPEARRTTEAERALSARLAGGCQVPFGTLAEIRGRRLALRAALASPSAPGVTRAVGEGPLDRWEDVVESVWRELTDRRASSSSREAG